MVRNLNYKRLGAHYKPLADQGGSVRRTRLTEVAMLPPEHGGLGAHWRPDRPALVVSSCSWTPDDDFSMMIDALDRYNREASDQQSGLPRMVFTVTGRGPLKDHYAELIRSRQWTHVEVVMPWLEWADYPVLLGCADLGVSLHNSSSGLDLPMKVADLLGVEVPVLALFYPTLSEMLPNNQIGCHFQTAEQLSTQLCQLLRKPARADRQGSSALHDDDLCGRFAQVGSEQLVAYRKNLKEYTQNTLRGRAYWRTVALPVFERAVDE